MTIIPRKNLNRFDVESIYAPTGVHAECASKLASILFEPSFSLVRCKRRRTQPVSRQFLIQDLRI